MKTSSDSANIVINIIIIIINILFCLSLSFCIFLSVKLRSYGHFPSPNPSVSPRGIFNKTHLLSHHRNIISSKE